MTGKESVRGSMTDREIRKEGLGFSELGSSPLGSFQSLHSSQGSERDKMIPYLPPLEEVKVLQFEDTLSEENCRNFNLIYESLLMEGKAGNLTDLTLGMVLAEKPLGWLQVLHGTLKHLIISSRASSSYFFSKFLFSPIFQQNSYFFLFFSQFAVEFFISGFFFRFYFFQCGNTCTERAVLWENFSHGVVWVRFSHKSLTNVWRSVDLTSPHPG